MSLFDFTNPNELKVYSIGYQGKSVSEFIDCLIKYNIKRIVDVRRKPYSKNKDFIIGNLRNILKEHKIRYVSYPDIAPTLKLREEFAEKKDIDKFFLKYDKFLKQNKGTIKKWIDILKDKDCLLCYERNHKKCHRSRLYPFIDGHIIPIKI